MIVLTRISLINLKNNRMDKLEYIPGDLAFHYIPKTIIKKYVKVYVCSTQNVLSLEDMDGNLYDYIGELYPIPLTPEILEKNGWDKEEKDGSVFSLSEAFMGGDEDDEDNYTCFQLYYQNKKDGWVIDMRGDPLKFGVHYVHELQHLLFGFGINHEMEV